MANTISLRTLQALLGMAYVLLAFVALTKSPQIPTIVVAAALMLGSYLTSRTLPDVLVSTRDIPAVCAIGLGIIAIGSVADAIGDPRILTCVAIVMAYCAGNRLRAAGIGPAA